MGAYSEGVIAAVAIALAISLGQEPNLSKVVPSPTGHNGYEEYVRAAMVVSRQDSKLLESYVRARERGSGGTPERPAGIPEGASLVDVYRIQLKLMAPALQLIRAGNEKPVSYPARISAVTLMPELSYWKVSARLFQRGAYVAFADGDTAAGTRWILDGLTFAKKMAVGGLIHFLVSGASEQILFSAIQRHLRSFSLPDIERLENWAENSLAAPTGLLSAAEIERSMLRNSVVDLLGDPKELLQVLAVKEEEQAAFVAKVKAISPARREELYRRFFSRLEWPWNALLARLREPEKTWLDEIEIDSVDDREPSVAGLNLTEGQAMLGVLQIMTMLGIEDSDIVSYTEFAARFRIQERLLRLYLGVLRFKWQNERLPSSLQEVFGTEPTDAATGKPYVFEPHEGGSFRIVCQTKRLGDVDLVYVASQAGGDEGPVPP